MIDAEFESMMLHVKRRMERGHVWRALYAITAFMNDQHIMEELRRHNELLAFYGENGGATPDELMLSTTQLDQLRKVLG